VSPIEAEVRVVRARMRRSAGLGAAVRWSLYGALLAGGGLAAAKLFGWPRAPLWIAAALPALAASLAVARRLDLRHAAASIDRALGLEERVATALEVPSGPLGAAVAADAARALEKSRPREVGRFRWPPEAGFLLPALALIALIALAPDPGRSVPTADPALRAAVDREIDRLERMAVADPALAAKVAKVLEDLKSDDLRRMAEGAAAAKKLAVEIRINLAKGAASGNLETLRALAESLEAAGAGASSELARRHIEVPDPAPEDIEARIAAARARGDLAAVGGRPEARTVSLIPPGASLPIAVREEIERRLASKPIDRRYHDVVRRYYERYEVTP
jgi:catechol 2,3-dioxygenase-like lactoylglutathione lyase family enzyme